MPKDSRFLVIKRKLFKEVNHAHSPYKKEPPAVTKLLDAVDEFNEACKEELHRKMEPTYVVVNKDEPYAGIVWDLIAEHES